MDNRENDKGKNKKLLYWKNLKIKIPGQPRHGFPGISPDVYKRQPYERVEFDEILAQSDILSIHAQLNQNTENLMNKAAFEKMKNSAILINVGRGPIVNDADLVAALNENQIAAAGLDVLTKEPVEEMCIRDRLYTDKAEFL